MIYLFSKSFRLLEIVNWPLNDGHHIAYIHSNFYGGGCRVNLPNRFKTSIRNGFMNFPASEQENFLDLANLYRNHALAFSINKIKVT